MESGSPVLLNNPLSYFSSRKITNRIQLTGETDQHESNVFRDTSCARFDKVQIVLYLKIQVTSFATKSYSCCLQFCLYIPSCASYSSIMLLQDGMAMSACLSAVVNYKRVSQCSKVTGEIKQIEYSQSLMEMFVYFSRASCNGFRFCPFQVFALCM